MTFIESHDSLREHPKTRRAARTLDISRAQLIGHLHMLWWWAMAYADDGDLTVFDAADIADGADWEDDPDTFVDALLTAGPGDSVGFLERTDDGRLLVHDWETYAGKLIERRRANRERMRSKRAEHVQDTCAAQTPHVQSDRTVPNRRVNSPIGLAAADAPPVPEEKPEREPTTSEPFQAVAAMCAVLGTDPHAIPDKDLAKQCNRAKLLLKQGYSVEEIRGCTAFLASQDWRDDGIDMFTVGKAIAKWRLNGRPALAEPRASSNGHGEPQYLDITGIAKRGWSATFDSS